MKLFCRSNLFILVALLASFIEAKKFDKCSLAKALLSQGFSKNDLRNWVCLVQNESGMDTTKKNNNRNGSTDWGLFQINDRYWCDPQDKNKKTSNECKVKCVDLLSDNIAPASTCAKKIFKRHGFKAWYGWINKCQGKPLPDLSKCKL
ncbi:lysozyme-like [Toxorhynchites rutilus septentrionalis]|uniref:lysozyme-like n=1 Tax=Toxorhynchites rutilus septentrionalis TaxID=329112 RepID=UPI0024791A39|nr:lysozyme-like [Toxorhynchites rutilus septentrionalis]